MYTFQLFCKNSMCQDSFNLEDEDKDNTVATYKVITYVAIFITIFIYSKNSTTYFSNIYTRCALSFLLFLFLL